MRSKRWAESVGKVSLVCEFVKLSLDQFVLSFFSSLPFSFTRSWQCTYLSDTPLYVMAMW